MAESSNKRKSGDVDGIQIEIAPVKWRPSTPAERDAERRIERVLSDQSIDLPEAKHKIDRILKDAESASSKEVGDV